MMKWSKNLLFKAVFASIIIDSFALYMVPHPFLVPNSKENIQKLRWIGFDENAEEYSGQYEGDMVLSPEQVAGLISRTGLINLQYRWPNKTIPYEISEDFDEPQKDFIRFGLDDIEAISCLKFVPRTDENAYVSFTGEDTGCHSEVGFQNNVQDINLQPNEPGKGCFRRGTIVHEALHALGFFHMQSASDRDTYVDIIWDNIIPGKENNFMKRDDSVVTNFGINYDYGSVMHYSATAFSVNGQKTIVPKDSKAVIGQRDSLSESDIKRINAMYCIADSDI